MGGGAEKTEEGIERGKEADGELSFGKRDWDAGGNEGEVEEEDEGDRMLRDRETAPVCAARGKSSVPQDDPPPKGSPDPCALWKS